MGFCPSIRLINKAAKEMLCGWKSMYKVAGNGVNKKLENESVENGKKIIKGTVILMKKNVLDFTDLQASFLDRIHELVGKGVSLQLICASDHHHSGFFFFVFFFLLRIVNMSETSHIN